MTNTGEITVKNVNTIITVVHIQKNGLKWAKKSNMDDTKSGEETSSLNDYGWKNSWTRMTQTSVSRQNDTMCRFPLINLRRPPASRVWTDPFVSTWPLCDRQRGIYLESFILSGDSWCFNGRSWRSKSLHLESNALKSLGPIFQRICCALFDVTSTS